MALARPFVGWPASPKYQLDRLTSLEASSYRVVADTGGVMPLRRLSTMDQRLWGGT